MLDVSCWLIAQVTPQPSPLPEDPTAGWFQVLLQFGAFGALLWIVFALAPKHLKEAADERKLAMEATAKERQDRDRRFNKLMVMMHKKFDARNDKIVAAVKELTKELIQEMGQSCRFHGDCDNFRPRHETMLQPHSTQQEKDK